MFRVFAGGLAALVIGGSALAAAGLPYQAEPFRLLRVFQLMPGPQRGLNVWLDEADLLAAKTSKSQVKQVRALFRHMEDGKPAGWGVFTSRYDCDKGQVTQLKAERVDAAGKLTVDRKRKEPNYLVPHTPDGFIYSLVCDGGVLADAPRVVGVDAALAFDAKEDAEFLKANPPAE